jgi:opacity protein-like surface antigen
MGSGVMNCLPQGLAPAVSQQAVIDAQAQQNRNRQAQQLGQQKEEKEQSVETSEISKDLGSVQLMREVPSLPFARLRIDQTYNWLSNASYAKSSANVLASWQTISSIEAAWAPSITSMPGYDKFFPEAGFRASFFNYFQQEEPSQSQDLSIYDIGVVQDFVLTNLFLRANKQISDELTVGLSFDYNGYFFLNSQDERQATSSGTAGPNNFLNEFSFAYSSSWLHSFNERQAISINCRASYVFTDSPGSEPYSSSYLTRSDNSLTGTYFVNLSDKLSLSPFASYRLAYYTDAQNAPPGSDSDGQLQNGYYRRLDQQYTLGLGLNFALSPELNTGLSFNYSKSDSTSRIVETGDFTNLTAGANWSMTYKFSEKEFVVAENTECLGPYVRTDLGFSFPNNLNSSQSLVGTVLPGVTGTLSNPSISINPGVHFDVSPGYNFNDWLGAEFSAGILYNGLDHLNGNGSVTTDGSSTPTSISTGGVAITGRYLQVPAIVSSVFRWPGKGRWKPYLSTGFGLAYSQLQVTEINNAQTSDQFAQQFSPAFSIGSGFNWQVSDMVDFDAMYKLLGVINPYYSGFHPGVPISNSFQFGINVRF